MKNKAFMIAGTHSGCGKSTVAMGLNRLLSRKGFTLQPWKCGPDYIDPGFHSVAAGRICRNLDTRLMDKETVRSLFSHHGESADISLVEGVMGFYDGDAGRHTEGSSYDLAKTLGLPVFLVLDVRSMAQSAGALASGFSSYKEDAPLAGFILNRTGSARHVSMVRDAVEKATGLPVLGCLPRNESLSLPERHLGLVLAEERNDELEQTLEGIADLLEEHLDLDKMIALMERKNADKWRGRTIYKKTGTISDLEEDAPVIAVARDEAFAFYYQDNLDLLKDRGAVLKEFSPVEEESLPEGAAAVYFGGGYPERFARRLSENTKMLDSLRSAAARGMPLYGECGGYMYMAESLRTADGTLWPMAGLLPGKITMTGKLRALGYGDVRWEEDNFLAEKGTVVPGHLFHWSCLEEDPPEKRIFTMDKKGDILNEGFSRENVMASYVHFHFASEPALAENFVRAAFYFTKKQDKS